MRTLWRGLLGLVIGGVLSVPALALAASNVLTWQDNSTNEANFHIERKVIPTPTGPISCTVTPATDYGQIATTGANIQTFADAAVTEGTTYCYRVKASNPAGSSNYTNEAGRTVPFTVPAAPSGLTITGGP